MNPFEIQKQMFQEWEKNLGKYLEATMRQPEFMKIVGKNLESTMDFQGAVKKQLQKALEAGGIPTDAQLEGLYKTVNYLETRVLDLEEQVEDLEDELSRARAATQAAKPTQSAKATKPAKATRSVKAGRKSRSR